MCVYLRACTWTRRSTAAGCLRTKPGLAGGAVGTVLDVAAELGLGVHVGLAMTAAPLFTAHGRAMNTTTLAQYTALCTGIGRAVWAAYGTKHTATIQGWYSMLEFWNDSMWSTAASTWGAQFLQPLATALKTALLPAGSGAHTTVFASPYFVGNRTRRPASHGDLGPARDAAVWESVFTQWAPALDLVAPQDSMGAQGNSFENVSAYLGQISNASRRAGKAVWSNTELFEVYPPTCEWPSTCHGRHPAPFSRIVKH